MEDPLERIRNPDLRQVLRRIRERTGQLELSSRIQQNIQGFRTQKGIYKPAGEEHALWIRQTSRGIYSDEPIRTFPDGSWSYRYRPEAKGGITDMNLPTNRALLKSKEDRTPVGVFVQRSVPGSERIYEILGLAYITDFDGNYFTLQGESIDNFEPSQNRDHIPEFQPFEIDQQKRTSITRAVREMAFTAGVRRLYHERCSLCDLGYSFRGKPIGVEAAHIIPVEDRGTSADLRNGILLCRNHHSLFDSYLWTFDEDYKVTVTEDRDFRKSAEKNHILAIEGKKLPNLPEYSYDLPAQRAIRYRMEKFYSNQK